MKNMAAFLSADWQWENATAGATAGLATVTFSHSLDVVRTRFQVYDGRISNVPAYRNTPHALFAIARSEGLRGLYAGFYPAVLGSTISWGLYFFFYSKAKQRYLRNREELSPGFSLLQLQKQEHRCFKNHNQRRMMEGTLQRAYAWPISGYRWCYSVHGT